MSNATQHTGRFGASLSNQSSTLLLLTTIKQKQNMHINKTNRKTNWPVS